MTIKSVHLIAMLTSLILFGCTENQATNDAEPVNYFDNTDRDDVLSGGVKLIPIKTSKGTFNVWTRRVGNNPSIKVLLLHGGPTREQLTEAQRQTDQQARLIVSAEIGHQREQITAVYLGR